MLLTTICAIVAFEIVMKWYTFIFAAFAICGQFRLSFAQEDSLQIPVTEYLALYDLYNRNGGDQWDWKPTDGKPWDFTIYENPCLENWQGVWCITDAAQNLTHVCELILSDMQLEGNLPNSIGNLPWLVNLLLDSNYLTGTVPTTVNKLTNLEILNLNHNLFEGPLPYLGSLTKLIVFDFYVNLLTGPLPEYLHLFANLIYVDFYNNHFTGTIPESYGTLIHLQYFYLGANHLTGTLPHSLGNLKSISSFYVDVNLLHGTVPAEIATFANLTYLFLNQNSFSGSVLGWFNATLQVKLSIVRMSDNQFTGGLPTKLFQLPALTILDAGSNCLVTPLPSSVCSCSNLRVIALDGLHTSKACRTKLMPGVNTYQPKHSLIGTIPKCIYELPRLETLHLSSNGVVGTLPADVKFGPHLRDIGMSHNNDLTGPLPSVWQTRRWKNLDLSHTRLSGTLDSDFAEIGPNQTLSLDIMRLSGTLPRAIIESPTEISVLEGNLFAGSVPAMDSYVGRYQSGSDTFEVSCFAWLGVVGLCGLALCISCALRQNWNVYTDVANFLSCKETVMKRCGLRNLYRVLSAGEMLLYIAAGVMLYVLVLMLPLECILSAKYSTLTHTYAYNASLAFVSGLAPLVSSMTLMIALLAFTYWWYTRCVTDHINRLASFPTMLPIVLETRKSMRDSVAETVKKGCICHMYFWMAAADIGLVIGLNCAFAWMVLYGNKMTLWLAPLTLSLAKVGWSSLRSLAVTHFARQFDEKDPQLKQGLLTTYNLVTVVNNLLIPCMVMLCISTSCWYNAFAAGDKVVSSFNYEECGQFTEDGCVMMQEETQVASFFPPFVYSNQCASNILTSYAPSFMYTSIIQAVLLPMMRRFAVPFLLTLIPTSYKFADKCIPALLKPLPPQNEKGHVDERYSAEPGDIKFVTSVESDHPSSQDDAGKSDFAMKPEKMEQIFDARTFLVLLINNLVVIMTFGVVFPPIAFCMIIAMLSHIYFTSLEVIEFVRRAELAGRDEYVQRINLDCEGVGNPAMLWRAVLLVISVSSLFYFLFFFDILGDQVGFGACWVLIPSVGCPLILCGGALYYYSDTVDACPPYSTESPLLDALEIEMIEKNTWDGKNNV